MGNQNAMQRDCCDYRASEGRQAPVQAYECNKWQDRAAMGESGHFNHEDEGTTVPSILLLVLNWGMSAFDGCVRAEVR